MAENKTENKTTVRAADLEGADLRHLSVEQVQGLKDTQLSKLTPEQVGSLSPEQLAALSPEQLGSISNEARVRLPADQQTRITHAKAAEALNPSEVDLAPGYVEGAAGAPLKEKAPHYAPSAAPQAGASRYVAPTGQGTPDQRVPPENVTMTTTATTGNEPKAGQGTATPVNKDPDPNTISAVATPADVGLPRPELKAGQAPLPEEDPTPSIVPIPPPGPKRVA